MARLRTGNLRQSPTEGILDTVSDLRGWVSSLLLLNLLDTATTVVGLQLGIGEGNPIQASLLTSYGELALLFSKLMLVAALILVLHLVRIRFHRLWPFGLAMIVPTVIVVANNLLLIYHALS